MGVSVLTQASTFDLVTLAVVKDECGIASSNTAFDARLSRLITRKSRALAEICGRVFARQQYAETIPGTGTVDLYLQHYPVAQVTVSQDDEELDDFTVATASVGKLFREFGWTWTIGSRLTPHFAHFVDRTYTMNPDYLATYWGGYLLPGDDRTGVIYSFASADKSVNGSSGKFPYVASGDKVRVSGSSANSKTFTVVSRVSDTKITFEEAVTTEAVGPSVTLAVRTLPEALEDFCVTLVSAAHKGIGRDPGIIVDRVENRELRYARPFANSSALFNGLIAEIDIAPYMRIAA
jgi:hypothetical protein